MNKLVKWLAKKLLIVVFKIEAKLWEIVFRGE